jgi:hypothetical protein
MRTHASVAVDRAEAFDLSNLLASFAELDPRSG